MIEQNNSTTHIFVLYDGIENSVFESQILTPLLELRKKHPTKKIVLISFEKKQISQELLKKRIPANQIDVVLLKKYPFIGFWSLYPAVCQLRKFLARCTQYDLVARGPLAGYLCLHASQKDQRSFTIQIRGLLAEEYRYEHRHEKQWLKKRVHAWRAFLYERLAILVFDAYKNASVHYQVVSETLQEYLHTKFGIAFEHLSVALHDVPHVLPSQQVQTWRGATRTTLGFDDRQFVYCYNGSLKSWQCPEKIIAFFQDVLKKNPHSFLLILTPDVQNFEKLLGHSSLTQECYKVTSVDYNNIFRYLAACDAGIIFREDHILNWISRPTKILEYYAVGLPIIHNATIGLLVKKENQ